MCGGGGALTLAGPIQSQEGVALEHKGEGAEAWLVYEQLRTVLRDELGPTLSPLSQALHRHPLGNDG